MIRNVFVLSALSAGVFGFYLANEITTPPISLQVEEFPGGPDPNDQTVMIQNAIDYAKTQIGTVTLHFKPDKCYFVSKHGGGVPGLMPFALKIEDASRITLEGHGAELRCTNRDTVILYVHRSDNIQVRDLRFDYYPSQFTQGTVIEVFPQTKEFDLVIDEGHAQLSDPWFQQRDPPGPFQHHAIHLQPDADEWVYDSVAHAWLVWRATPDGAWRCRSGHRGPYGWYEELDVGRVRVGDRIVIAGLWGERATKHAGHPTIFDQCADCMLYSCEFYNGEAFTQCFGGTRMAVVDCKFIPRKGDAPEGVDRIWAGVGDGALFEHMDEGPYVINSEIRCVPDDIMNFNCPPFVCYARWNYPGRTMLRLGGWICATSVKVGDTLCVSDGTTGLTRFTFEVSKIINWSSPYLHVETTDEIPNFELCAHEGMWPFIEDYNSPADKIQNLNASNRNALIRGNVFDTCGNFLRLPKLGAVIENNEFRNIAETPIMGEVNTYYWLDWPRHKGITIRGNRFVNCQWTRGFHDQTLPNWHVNDHHRLWRNGIIHLSVYRWGAVMAEPVVRDIEITNNVIEGWGQSAIRIEGATLEDRTVRNEISDNILIERNYAHPKRFLQASDGTYPTVLVNSEHTNAKRNLVTLLPDSSAQTALLIAGDCHSTIDWSFDSRSWMPSGVRWVDDLRVRGLGTPPPADIALDQADDRVTGVVVDAAAPAIRGVTVRADAAGSVASRISSLPCPKRHALARRLAGPYACESPAILWVLGKGCSGSSGVPILAAHNLPWVGAEFTLEVGPVHESATSVSLLIGLVKHEVGLSTLGAPGCVLQLHPWSGVLQVPCASGRARSTITIPNQPSLVGASFYVQALATDRSANSLGIAVSNALHGVIGRR